MEFALAKPITRLQWFWMCRGKVKSAQYPLPSVKQHSRKSSPQREPTFTYACFREAQLWNTSFGGNLGHMTSLYLLLWTIVQI
jgi:hypothetical protein